MHQAECVDHVVQALHRLDGRPRAPRPPTDTEPLPGGEALDLEPLGQPGLELGLDIPLVDHLVNRYGTECAAVFNLVRERRELLRPLAPDHPAIEAEVLHVARRELALRVDDVLVRRLHLFYESADQGRGAAPRVAALLAEELGRDAAWMAAEVTRYGEIMTAARAGLEGA